MYLIYKIAAVLLLRETSFICIQSFVFLLLALHFQISIWKRYNVLYWACDVKQLTVLCVMVIFLLLFEIVNYYYLLQCSSFLWCISRNKNVQSILKVTCALDDCVIKSPLFLFFLRHPTAAKEKNILFWLACNEILSWPIFFFYLQANIIRL